MRTRDNQLLDGSDLLSVVVFFERDELRLHILDEGIPFGALELCKKFL